MNHITLKRTEIRKILTRHRGAKAELARRSKVGATAVTMWLRNGDSANIAGHAQVLCAELLAKEEVVKAA